MGVLAIDSSKLVGARLVFDCESTCVVEHYTNYKHRENSVADNDSWHSIAGADNQENATRIVRAARHLVLLLQSELRAKQTQELDPNDPFAKPPQ
jgi:hypothetical protein